MTKPQSASAVCRWCIYTSLTLGRHGDTGSTAATESNGYNVTEAPTGTSRAYSIARVQKACDPAVTAQVMAGTLSPNAALVQAGIRKNRQIYITRSMTDFAEKLRERLSNEDVALLAGDYIVILFRVIRISRRFRCERGQEDPEIKGDDITFNSDRGTSRDYILRRLERDGHLTGGSGKQQHSREPARVLSTEPAP